MWGVWAQDYASTWKEHVAVQKPVMEQLHLQGDGTNIQALLELSAMCGSIRNYPETVTLKLCSQQKRVGPVLFRHRVYILNQTYL